MKKIMTNDNKENCQIKAKVVDKTFTYFDKHKKQARFLIRWFSYSFFVLSCGISISLIVKAGDIKVMELLKIVYKKL